jgi:hypothetical protein
VNSSMTIWTHADARRCLRLVYLKRVNVASSLPIVIRIKLQRANSRDSAYAR